MKNKKGFWRMMESVLAVMLIMGFLISAGSVYYAGPVETDASSDGYKMLKNLDAANELRPYAASGDYAAINSRIEMARYNHSVQICDYSGACAGDYPDAQNVAVSTYVIAGYGQYEPMEVKLYIWW